MTRSSSQKDNEALRAASTSHSDRLPHPKKFTPPLTQPFLLLPVYIYQGFQIKQEIYQRNTQQSKRIG